MPPRNGGTRVAAIRALGVRVIYDYEDTAAGPPGPAWARRLLGVDFFADVIRIIPQRLMHNTPGDSPIQDACLQSIAELTCVERLDLQDSKVSGAGFQGAFVGLAQPPDAQPAHGAGFQTPDWST